MAAKQVMFVLLSGYGSIDRELNATGTDSGIYFQAREFYMISANYFVLARSVMCVPG